MDENLAQKAISTALSGNWKEAVVLNKKILGQNANDIDAGNRLARAYAEVGDTKKAKGQSRKVLKIDPFNEIAKQAISKWDNLKGAKTSSSTQFSPDAFLEEPGKTKLVDLLHPGPNDILLTLNCADEVRLVPHAHRVNVMTQEGKYIGRLPDDLSAKLRSLIKVGNQYKALIKSVEKNCPKVFIRETTKGSKASDTLSFSTEKIDYVSFTPPELAHRGEVEEEAPAAEEEIF